MNFDQVFERRSTGSMKWNKFPEKVLPLWVADMDFQSPPCVQETLNEIAEHNIHGYALPQKKLIRTVIERMDELYNWQIEASSIVWLPGLVPALNIVCRAYKQPKKKVLTTTPIYPPFLEAPVFSERQVLAVPSLLEGNRYEMDFNKLESYAEKSSLYLLCNPHNPTGRVYDREELERLAATCLKNDMVICSDDVHCDLILDEDKKHIPIATLSKEIEQRSVTLMSPSKTFNIPNFGFAFAIIPNYKLRHKFLRIMRGIVPYPGGIGLTAAHAVYNHGEPWRLELIKYLRQNRDYLSDFINTQMPRIKYVPGEATYLAWLDVRELKLEDPARFFADHGVGLSDGKPFDGKGFLRLNFGCPRATLDEALTRMKQAYNTI